MSAKEAAEITPLEGEVTLSKNVGGPNVAVTFLAEVIVTEQVPVPEQSPLHPVNTPEVAVAVKVNVAVVEGKLDEQVEPQLITLPAPEPTTVPVPEPALLTVKV
jgi:hypothetical protein